MSELNQSLIQQQLQAVEGLQHLHVVDVITSTSDYVLAQSSVVKVGAVACVANQQSHGRGRNGKHWVSPANRNIYLSVGYRFMSASPESLSCLSCASGVAICRLLEARGISCGLKWPNDIYVAGKKLAGILVETKVASKSVFAVIGLGLNVLMEPGDLLSEEGLEACSADEDSGVDGLVSGKSWTSLVELSACDPEGRQGGIDRNELAAQMIDGLIKACMDYEQNGFCHFEADWHRLDILKGQTVDVVEQQTNYSGKVLGLQDNCALSLEMGGQHRLVYAADVSLKIK